MVKRLNCHSGEFVDFGKTREERETLTDGDILRRIGLIEKRIDQIVFNKKKEKIDIKKNETTNENCLEAEIFFQRISVLERENKSLQDENKFLKTENEKLKGNISNKSYAAKFDVKNSQRESKPDKSRAESVEPSRAVQNSARNEAAGHARGKTTGKGQFQRYTEYSQEFAEEPEPLNKQRHLNTVDAREQSSFSFHKAHANQWQIPRETSKVQPLLSNQINTRNYFGVLEDCDTVSRELEKVKSDQIVAPGEIDYAESVKKRTDFEKVDRTMEPGDFSYADSLRAQQRWSRPTNSLTRLQADDTRYSRATEREVSSVRPPFHRGRDNPPFRSEGRKPRICITGDSMIKRIRRQDMSREVSGVNLYLKSFPGAIVDHMKHYMEPTISTNPDGIILHCGTNNLRNEEPADTANKIIDLAMTAKRRLHTIVGVSGNVLKSEIVGSVKMKCYLSGMPELRLGLNDKILFENTGRSKSKSVELEDVKFHQCVRLSRFENDRTISFIPPDGEFELMGYRLSTHVKPLIWIEAVIERHAHSRVEYMIKAKSQFKKRSTANNVEVVIPVPEDADCPKFKTTIGNVKYAPEQSSVIWTIKSFQGGKEYLMRAHFGLPSVISEESEGRPPISVKFEIPYFTVSGIQVRYLKIIEKSGYQALPWVRYITQNGGM
eukprot:Seg4563.1 transcript_id=Seg4563.1/GoldUCD/mRNA.D3Y31 product="AP-1 complex subunit mu-1" protein_id=Seg4563.1/GoldUCD/D3Y31